MAVLGRGRHSALAAGRDAIQNYLVHPHPSSRRAFLAISGTALGALWLAARPEEVQAALEHAVRAARSTDPLPWEALTPEQALDVDAISAQIIPTDDTPGAREARVVHFVDKSLATWAAPQREPFARELDALNAEVERRWPGAGRFAALAPERQTELLRAREQTPFFQQMWFATIAGMFSLPSYGGNADKIGWRLIGFDDRHSWQPPFGEYDAEASRGGE